jgi:AraC-like DNA-binding protein
MRLDKEQSEFSNMNIEDNYLNFGLIVNSVGYKSILPNESIARPNKFKDYKYQYNKGSVSDEFKLIYITKGIGYIHFENLEEIEISKGMVLIIMPHQKYDYYHINETEWKEHFIRFEADTVYYELINSLFGKYNQIVNVGFNEEIFKIFNRSIDVIRNELKSSQVYLSGMLLCLLGLIISESKNSATGKKEIQAIENAMLIMNENVMNEITLHEIALELKIGYSTFRKNFKKYTGHSPAKYFNVLRLNKAKQLLTESTCSIKEIAYLLQFSSIEHFATHFKKINGYTPKDFRVSNSKLEIVEADKNV